MNRTYKDLGVSEMNTEVRDRMLKSVVLRVEQFEVSRSKKRTIGYGALSIVAILAVIPVVIYIVHSAKQSGFDSYLSLVVSDGSSVLIYWREFLMSAASSLPLTGGILVLLTLLIFFNSLRKAVKYSTYSSEMRHRLLVT